MRRSGVIVRPVDGRFTYPTDAPFDVEDLLAQPLVARVVTAGSVVRPVWYLWEAEAFWIFIGPRSGMARRLRRDPAFALVVDVCDVYIGIVRQVVARGRGSVEPFDVAGAGRKLRRYLGSCEDQWDARFSIGGSLAVRGLQLARLAPDRLAIYDMSFRPSLSQQEGS
jgi:hypothetical protein